MSSRYDDRATEIIGYYNACKGYNRRKSYKGRGKKKSGRKVTGIYVKNFFDAKLILNSKGILPTA